jgi:hypothetical protein
MSETAPDTRIVGYCRACGKALDESTVRSAHGTIYCEEHMPPAYASVPPLPGEQPSSAPPQYQASPYVAPQYGSPYASSAPPPIPESGVSPGLAFVLGLIPGVGAIYNGQYAKGLVHVFILGLLITIASSDAAGGAEAIVGLLIAAFCAYMPFEAYHTAQKRQRGQPVDEFSGLSHGSGASRFPAMPVVLIIFGVVFLLNNLEIFELRRILRYWPALMIALGVYLLWVRMSGAQKTNGASRPQDGGQL